MRQNGNLMIPAHFAGGDFCRFAVREMEHACRNATENHAPKMLFLRDVQARTVAAAKKCPVIFRHTATHDRADRVNHITRRKCKARRKLRLPCLFFMALRFLIHEKLLKSVSVDTDFFLAFGYTEARN